MSGLSPGPVSTTSHTGEESSASSIINVDMGEGILGLADGEVGNAYVSASSPIGDEASKKALRDHLKNTLSKKGSYTDADAASRRSRRRKMSVDAEVDEVSLDIADAFPPRQYFVLTDAGKPVFTSRSIEHDPDNLASTMGIMQALISVFLDDGDKLRCVNAGSTRINILMRPPLYYACVSSWGEPESVTRSHLEYLHLQILSVVTVTQLRRIFERRSEILIHSLLERVESDMAMGTSSLHCLKLDPVVRSRAANHLVPTLKIKDLLYLILVAQGRVITLARPKKHSIHPADLHILMNTAHSPSIVNSSAPKTKSKTSQPVENPSPTSVGQEEDTAKADPFIPRKDTNPGVDVGLVCVTANGDFESIRNWCSVVIGVRPFCACRTGPYLGYSPQRLENDGTLASIEKAIRNGSTEYSVSDLSIPGLRHFIYKSRAHVQTTAPIYEEPYDDINERRR
ncbi:DUF254-domain-containing protein [Lactarius sanguifluus]|nr:DUF254-domain-containing protein [Lactarius sanguifluus]